MWFWCAVINLRQMLPMRMVPITVTIPFGGIRFYAVKIHIVLTLVLIMTVWFKISGWDCFVLILLKDVIWADRFKIDGWNLLLRVKQWDFVTWGNHDPHLVTRLHAINNFTHGLTFEMLCPRKPTSVDRNILFYMQGLKLIQICYSFFFFWLNVSDLL
jgi:hypothetical protein